MTHPRATFYYAKIPEPCRVITVAVEAFERGVVVTAHSDCLGQTSGIVLADGYTIEEVYTAKTSEELFEQLNA